MIWIEKARRRPPPAKTAAQRDEYNRQHRMAQRLTTPFKVDLVKGVTKFRNDVSTEDIARALARGSIKGVFETIPWHELPGALDPAMEQLADAAVKGSKSTIDALPKHISTNLRYDVRNKQVAALLKTRTGEQITALQDGTLAAVRLATRRALTHGLSPRDVADEIKGSIGLNDRQAVALSNFRAGLLARGKHTDDQVDRLVDAYGARLLDQRAVMIARTEVRFATNAAQQAVWSAADKDGLLPPDSVRVWIVDGNPCPELCRPMNGKTARLGEAWTLPDGREVMVPTESHPHCYCVEQLRLG